MTSHHLLPTISLLTFLLSVTYDVTYDVTTPPGFYSQDTGLYCHACLTTCSAGLEIAHVSCSAVLNNICTLCDHGFFKLSAGPEQCQPCTATCPPGYSLDSSCSSVRNPSCVACRAGLYKNDSTLMACLPCTTACGVGTELNDMCRYAVMTSLTPLLWRH